MAEKRVGVRLKAEGGERLKRDLQDIGTTGDRALRRINDAAKPASAELRALNAVTGALRSTIATAGAAIAGFVTVDQLRSMVMAADETQRLQLRLETLTGSTSRAAESYAYLFDASQRLGVGTISLADSYAKLLPLVQAGVLSTGQARTILEGLANTAAATGAGTEQLQNVMYGLGQALGAGRVQAEELNQVTEPLPGLLNQIAKAAGTTAGGFREQVKDGKITSEVFRNLLITALQEYEGAASKTADTVSGSYQRLSNAWRDLRSSLGESLAPVIAESNKALTELIEKFNEFFALGTKGKVANLDNQIEDTIARVRRTQQQLEEAQADFQEARSYENARAVTNLRENVKAYLKEYQDLVKQKSALQGELSQPPETESPGKPSGSLPEEPDKEEARRQQRVREAIANADASADAARRLSAARLEGEEAAKRQQAIIEAENEARRLGISLSSEQGQELLRLAKAQAEVEITGERMLKAQEAANDNQKTIDALREEIRLLEIKDEKQRFIEQNRKRLTEDATDAQRRAFDRQSAELYDLKKQQDDTKKALDDQKEAARELGLTFSSAFEDAIVSGAKFQDVLSGIAEDLLRLAVRRTVTENILSAFSSVIPSLGSLFSFGGGSAAASASSIPSNYTAGGGLSFSATGNVITADGPLPLRQYAKGGIARTPHVAIFGEGSQPEAFVPLPDGRTIPVTMQGGGNSTVVQIIDQRQGGEAPQVTRSQAANGQEIIRVVISEVAADISRNGTVGQTISRTFGLNRSLAVR